MDHPIARKLRSQFCPYLVTARRLWRWRPLVVYGVYSYVGELFVLLAGFGLANPLMAFLSGQPSSGGREKGGGGGSIVEYLSGSRFGWLAIGLLVVWGLAKFYVRTQDLEKRCSLARSYRRQCLQIEHALREALPAPNPMPALVTLQAKLSDLVDRSIAESAIPDLGIDEGLHAEMDVLRDRLVADFGLFWDPPPQNEQR